MNQMNKNYLDLVEYIKALGSVAIAFSGGVDSTFLLKASKDALGENAIAFTIDSPYIPEWEIDESKTLAKSIGIRHEIIKLNEIPTIIKNNPKDRCYLCKKTLFMRIKERGKALGYKHVIDGTNYDDTKEYRPGMKALKELDIISPLLVHKFTKKDIRRLSKELNLPTWDKPAYACLLTRFPYNTTLNNKDISSVEKAENYLMSIGFKKIRVRKHNDIARIEVAQNERIKLFDTKLLDEISKNVKEAGFNYVCFEAAGYVSGSFDEELSKDGSNE